MSFCEVFFKIYFHKKYLFGKTTYSQKMLEMAMLSVLDSNEIWLR